MIKSLVLDLIPHRVIISPARTTIGRSLLLLHMPKNTVKQFNIYKKLLVLVIVTTLITLLLKGYRVSSNDNGSWADLPKYENKNSEENNETNSIGKTLSITDSNSPYYYYSNANKQESDTKRSNSKENDEDENGDENEDKNDNNNPNSSSDDSEQENDPSTQKLTTPNKRPIITLLNRDFVGEIFNPGEIIHIPVKGYDSDGEVVKLSILLNDIVIASTYSNEADFFVYGLSLGMYTVSVEATDNQGATSKTADYIFFVDYPSDNQKPISNTISTSLSRVLSNIVSIDISNITSFIPSNVISHKISDLLSGNISELLSDEVSDTISVSISGSISKLVSITISDSISSSISPLISIVVSNSISEIASNPISKEVSNTISTLISNTVSNTISDVVSEIISPVVSANVKIDDKQDEEGSNTSHIEDSILVISQPISDTISGILKP